MDERHNKKALSFKAFADPNRLMIVDMLSCGELCACRILSKLGITQPTLSHHMKILCDCGLVNSRRDGKWMYYALNTANLSALINDLSALTATKTDHVCGKKEACDCE